MISDSNTFWTSPERKRRVSATRRWRSGLIGGIVFVALSSNVNDELRGVLNDFEEVDSWLR